MNQQEAVTQIVTSLQSLADGLTALFNIYKEPDPKEPVPASTPDTPVPKLEDVRAVLSAISRAGKRSDVQRLLEQFGVQKLSDLDPAHYPAILQAAEELQ